MNSLVELLLAAGPWIVFVAAFAETAFFIGLLIPAEATILVAAFLADRGYFNVWVVLAMTFFGGLLGDQVGYFLGRYGGGRIASWNGRVSRIWQRTEPRVASLFRRHAAFSVSFARFISFVRTLMPWFAGMSAMPYQRFLVFDILGVLGWAIASVLVGYVAGESWNIAAERLGTGSAIVLGVAVVVTLIMLARAHHKTVHEPVATPGVLRVALTGNIASGKSTIADTWQRLGANVIDADVLSRRAVEPGSAGLARIRQAFGDNVLEASGALDRARMREIVFSDPEKRAQLEEIVHPEVQRLREEEEQKLVDEGVRLIVNDIPLLFETGMENSFDVVVLADASEATRLKRLTELRDMPEDEAMRMIAAQMPSEQKRARADIVIANEGTIQDLVAQAEAAWKQLQERLP